MNNNQHLKIYKLAEFAEILGVHPKTLQKWDRQGLLKARRAINNRRYYTNEELEKALNSKA